MRQNKEVKQNNKGFSLVELIVVIAIMIVLVAVLAPVFTRYIEQSRRATDVQNANSIAEAVLIDAADGHLSSTALQGNEVVVSGTNRPTAIQNDVTTRGNAIQRNATFSYIYTESTNTVNVFVTGDTSKTNLSTEAGATAYRDGTIGNAGN